MLITYPNETSGRATGDCQPGRSRMRDGAMPRNSIHLRASLREVFPPGGVVLGRRTTTHPYSSCRESDVALRVFGSVLFLMFILPLILAGIAIILSSARSVAAEIAMNVSSPLS